MTLTELFAKIKEEGLSKDQLEDLYTKLSAVIAEMYMEMAQLEKSEALYLDQSEEKTKAGAERKWFAQKQGQRQLELKNFIRAGETQLRSIKNRLYSNY